MTSPAPDKAAFLARHLQRERLPEKPPALETGAGAGHNLARAAGWKGGLARAVRRFVPRPDMVHIRKREQRIVDRFLADATAGASDGTAGFVLNVGSGDHDYGPRCVNLDIFEGKNVDVVATGDAIPFPDASFDGVMTLATLEHVPDERAVLAECARVAKPGALCLHAVPFIQGFHAVPDDYRRLTVSGLRALLDPDFEEIESGVLLGPASGAAWTLREFFAIATAGRSTLLYNAGMLFWGWVFWPLKFLDVLMASSPFAGQIASGVYYLGRRRENALPGSHDPKP